MQRICSRFAGILCRFRVILCKVAAVLLQFCCKVAAVLLEFLDFAVIKKGFFVQGKLEIEIWATRELKFC